MMNNLNVTGRTRSRDQCEEDNLRVTRNRSSIDFYLLFVVPDFFCFACEFFSKRSWAWSSSFNCSAFPSFLQPCRQSDVMATRYDFIGNKRSSYFLGVIVFLCACVHLFLLQGSKVEFITRRLLIFPSDHNRKRMTGRHIMLSIKPALAKAT